MAPPVFLSIYFDEIKQTQITQTAKLQISDLFANIGGQLGLFVGLGVLNVVELLQFGFRVMGIFIVHTKKRVLKKGRAKSNFLQRFFVWYLPEKMETIRSFFSRVLGKFKAFMNKVFIQRVKKPFGMMRSNKVDFKIGKSNYDLFYL